MADSWHLLGDDPDERRWFHAPGAWAGLAAGPAGPPNRRRRVEWLAIAGRRWFVKTFSGTQWQNRLRFRLTRPHAATDAEREWAVTTALRAAGHAAPRPVAWGTAAGVAYYVCAELPGASFAARLAAGTADRALADAVARHCGRLLAEGFWLPDLAADHVFVATAAGAPQLAVLDLHNGRLGRPGRAPHWLCRRVLRHFGRSVRSLGLPWPAQLRFAAALLRAAGRRGPAARAVLRRLPPPAPQARYERAGRSAAYAERNPARHARELDLLQRVWPGRAGETVLDLPCGAGRLHGWLRDRGHAVVQADGALAMLRETRQRGAGAAAALQADARAMPLRDGAVAGVVMFRFLHHLQDADAAQALGEACRVAGRFVVVSFFHPCSAHHLQRWLRQAWGGPATRFARPLGAVDAIAARHGFRRVAAAADLPFLRDLWLAAYVREPLAPGSAAAPPLRPAP